MSGRQQFAQEGSQLIPVLQGYIQKLREGYGQRDEMAEPIRRLSEELFKLRNAQLVAADNSEELKQAIADLRRANAEIQREINDAKEFSERVQMAAAIAGLIQRAIGLAVA